MYKRPLLLFTCVLLLGLVGTPAMALVITPNIGPTFDAAVDIGANRGIGSTMYQGQNTYAGQLMDEYFITAGGADIWGTADQFHYAYKTVTGDVRMWMGYKYQAWDNDWVKVGPMFRDGLANNAIMVYNAVRRGPWDATNLRWTQDRTAFQGRLKTGAGATSIGAENLKPAGVEKPVFIGVQRVTYKGLPFIEGLVDWGTGAGWERSGSLLLANPILNQPGIILPVLPDETKLGVCATSHREWSMSQTWVYGAQYEQNPSLVGPLPVFVDNPGGTCIDVPGFKIRSIKISSYIPVPPTGWGYNAMNELLSTGTWMGLEGEEEGTRIEQFVNLHDSSGRGEFTNDQTFPGIDDFQQPTTDPAGGLPGGADDDNYFATEVLACIKLTAGLHIIGVNSDDGAIVKIGGVEVGRTAEAKGASNVDFVYEVLTPGLYSLEVRHIEATGGASLELQEIINVGGQWTRILLGDVASGGSPVYVPEPATIALLGLGALALVRRKK
jgi:hypothetical protein